ncbi:MAG: S-layer glycoprotein N-glycosyltransferase AglJ [Methanomicrobiaceae archaeon]|nr:S-layer glycoprotein N-glycosyltransferase AglJ [Methanomicrobiaceae archaeon]
MEIIKDDVCIFIPTLNEAPTIGPLIRAFKERGYRHILVLDGNSSDRTADIARNEGARVAIQTGRGKGNAIIEAIDLIERPYVLMLDGDGTYAPEEAETMLRPLFEGADHVIGNRLENPDAGALTRLNRFGNDVINYLFKMAHGRYLYDILSGYRAFTLQSAKMLHLRESGFEIETEMAAEAVRHNQTVVVVPVQYRMRPGTDTKLSPLKDGLKIISAVYRMAKMSNPLFYFGLIGLVFLAIGSITGLYVVYEWIQRIEHIPLTILTVLLLVLGFNIFMFGVISDMILTFHREVMREIYRLKPPNSPK